MPSYIAAVAGRRGTSCLQMNINEDRTVIHICTYATLYARLHEVTLSDGEHLGFMGGAVEHRSCKASILPLEGL